MCLLCNGRVSHTEDRFTVGSQVRFRDSPCVSKTFQNKFPGVLTVVEATNNAPENLEQMGPQFLRLTTEQAPVEHGGVYMFSSDLFCAA